MTINTEDMRITGMYGLAIAGWFAAAATGLVALAGSSSVMVAAAICAGQSVVPTWAAMKRRTHGEIRIVVAVLAICQSAAVLHAMQGNAWQADMHLLIVVSLALLVPLCDVRAIVVASVVAVLHHALAALLAPHWLFGEEPSQARVFLNIAGLALAGGVMCAITANLRETLRRVAELELCSAGQAQQIKDGLEKLEAARAEIKSEREDSARKHAQIIAAAKTANQEIAADIERSISAVARSAANTAQLLADASSELKSLSETTTEEVRIVVGSAARASKAANTVAAGVAELSLSIAEVAANASQQNELTHLATERSGGGGMAIGTLTQQSRTIGETTRAIVRIAERTNLLSLNAAIEAASAGPAGRGFSIVASEVKALADQASAAANQIDAFLKGVQTGTLEAERSFKAIDSAVSELDKAATSIRYDVENQRQSADTIESFALHAARDVDVMVGQIRSLSAHTGTTARLSDEFDRAAAMLAENIDKLETSAQSFASRLRSA